MQTAQTYFLPFLATFFIGVGIYCVFYALLLLWRPLPCFVSWGLLLFFGGGYFPFYTTMFIFFPMIVLLSFVGAYFAARPITGSGWKYWWALAAFFPAQIVGMGLNLMVGMGGKWVPDGSPVTISYLTMVIVSPTVGAFLIWFGKRWRGTLPEDDFFKEEFASAPVSEEK